MEVSMETSNQGLDGELDGDLQGLATFKAWSRNALKVASLVR